jgi:hypothetical protein
MILDAMRPAAVVGSNESGPSRTYSERNSPNHTFQCFVDGVLVNSHTVKMDPDAGEGRAG